MSSPKNANIKKIILYLNVAKIDGKGKEARRLPHYMNQRTVEKIFMRLPQDLRG